MLHEAPLIYWDEVIMWRCFGKSLKDEVCRLAEQGWRNVP